MVVRDVVFQRQTLNLENFDSKKTRKSLRRGLPMYFIYNLAQTELTLSQAYHIQTRVQIIPAHFSMKMTSTKMPQLRQAECSIASKICFRAEQGHHRSPSPRLWSCIVHRGLEDNSRSGSNCRRHWGVINPGLTTTGGTNTARKKERMI
jgi:hypothetical protein